MDEGFIFWRQPLRVAGPRNAAEAIERLRALLQARRFGLGQRLAGRIVHRVPFPRVRVWRRGPLSAAGDLVEFAGTLREDGAGSAFEGTLAYTLGSRVQFAGLLAIGAAVTVSGVVQADPGLWQFGLLLTAGVAVWIYASSRLRTEQARFIEAHLAQCVRGEGDDNA